MGGTARAPRAGSGRGGAALLPPLLRCLWRLARCRTDAGTPPGPALAWFGVGADDEGDVEGPHLLISAIEQTEAEEASGAAAREQQAADPKPV